MTSWKDILVAPEVAIRDAIRVLDESALQIVLVVRDGRLVGTMTDGDVRRAILKGVALDNPVSAVMNCAPTLARAADDRSVILGMMRQRRLRQIPIVDDEDRVVGLETLEDLIRPGALENRVMLMAGGLGSRLHPLTAECPKPMLKVGLKPLLEIILENLAEYGFRRFYISVNYMADMVKSHFGNGSAWGVDIEYLHEQEKLGTAGALSLIPERLDKPLLVMNGDLLTKVNFAHLLEFHASHHAHGTMCVREYDFQIPYGVVTVDNHRIVSIDEKPTQRVFVNAGIYVLEQEALDLVPRGTRLDMPALFERLMKEDKRTAVFPVREYWMDIGQLSDYDQANSDFLRIFR